MGLRNLVKERLLTDSLAEESMFLWMGRPEKWKSAVAKRPIQSQSSLLSWWTGQLNAAASSSWLSCLEACEALSWAGLNALRGVWEGLLQRSGTSNSIQGFSAALWLHHVKSCGAAHFALWKQCVTHSCFHLPVQFSMRYHFTKCFCAGRAAEEEERGMWSTMSLESSYQLLTNSPVHEPGFP